VLSALAALAVSQGSCSSQPAFVCTQDQDCALAGRSGICSSGACALPASDCSSGYRYDTSAGNGLGGICVAAIPPPTPIAPLSGALVTTTSPSFTCNGSGDAYLDVCADHTCKTVVRSFTLLGCTGPSPVPFAPGPVFYRLHGLSGHSAGPRTSPVIEFFVGHKVAPVSATVGAVADVNADGKVDLLVGAPGADTVYLYLGSPSGFAATPSQVLHGPAGSQFGAAVAAAGDLDADGFPDAAVGAPGATTVYLYRGSSTGLPSTASGMIVRASLVAFGESVTSAGDYNGDGLGDLAIGSQQNVDLYDGPACSTSSGCNADAEPFGAGLVAATDLNGDGFGDVVIPAGTVLTVYLGPQIGCAAQPLINLPAPAASVAAVGDVNGDGFGDFAVGMPSTNSAYLYLGSRDFPPCVPSPMPLTRSVSSFGTSLAGGWDVDGDGNSDLIVGAPSAKQAFLFLGPATAAPIPVTSGLAGFGQSVAIPGDIDGSGTALLAVGAPTAESTLLYPWQNNALGTPTTLMQAATGFGAALALLAHAPTPARAASRGDGRIPIVTVVVR
jgi:hypothetical protein